MADNQSDKIDISAFDFANFAAVQAVMVAQDEHSGTGKDNTQINLDADTFLIIEDVQISQFTAADFLL